MEITNHRVGLSKWTTTVADIMRLGDACFIMSGKKAGGSFIFALATALREPILNDAGGWRSEVTIDFS
jgi:hypothetical protein